MEFQKAKRLEHFKTGIFAALDERKEELLKQGRQIYNLSIGTPDFKPPQSVMDAVSEAAKNPENYKYAMTDIPELTEALCEYYKNRFDTEIFPDETVSVHGSQEGIGHLGLALCSKGDIVMLPDPGYPVFEAGAFLGDAEEYFYSLTEESHFMPEFDKIPEDVLKRAKYIILSYPSNPSGAVATKEMYLTAIEYAKKYGFIIVNDNAYSDIIFDGRENFSFLSLPGAREVGVEFFSLSKSFDVTGARISFMIGNKSVVNAMKLLRSQYDFGVFRPVQYGALAALKCPRDFVENQKAEYQKRRDALCGGLRRIGWNVPDSHGTMFVWAKLPDGYDDSFEFCTLLMEKAGIICTPGEAFGKNGKKYVRFALTKSVDEINRIVEVIKDSGIIK